MILNKAKTKLAIVTTHPIQYYAPFFKLMAARKNIQLKVFYTWGERAKAEVFDRRFGKLRTWDIPLLDGYEHDFITNTSKTPGSHHFTGIINPGLVDKIELYRPNAILVFGWAFQTHLKVLRHFKGKIPVFFRGDSTLLDEPKGISIKKLARRLFLKWVYSHVDYALYVGSNNKNYYLAHGLNKSQLIYAPHAVDNSRFSHNALQYEEDATLWRTSLGIAPGTTVMLFAGKLEPKKNPLLLVEAAKAMPEVHFIIVGNGALENDIKQASVHLSNVTLLSFQNQSKMPVVYRLADIFVLPSKGPGETWGLAINEAMASGRMVIASEKCGGAADLITNGKNGFIIEPEVQSLLKVLHTIRYDKNVYRSYGDESLKRIGDFTFDQIAEAIETAVLKTGRK